MPPVLFICDAQPLEQLLGVERFRPLFQRLDGTLPDLCRQLTEFSKADTSQDNGIVCCDAEMLRIPAEAERLCEFEQFVVSTIGNWICRLMVFGTADSDASVQEKIEDAKKWMTAFTSCAKPHRGNRELRFVWIVIGLSNERMEKLVVNAMDGIRPQPIVFHMANSLVKAKDYLPLSQKVWPLPVTLLLAGLASTPMDDMESLLPFRDAHGSVFRWRGALVVPDRDEEIPREAQAQWDGFKKNFAPEYAANEVPVPSAESRPPSSPSIEMQTINLKEYEDAVEYVKNRIGVAYKEEIDKINEVLDNWRQISSLFESRESITSEMSATKDLNWLTDYNPAVNRTMDNGDSQDGRLEISQLLIQRHIPEKEIGRLFWATIQEKPERIFDQRVSSWGQEVASPLKKNAAINRIKEIARKEREKAEAIKRLRDTQYELELARDSFIPIWGRLWVAAKATLKVGLPIVLPLIGASFLSAFFPVLTVFSLAGILCLVAAPMLGALAGCLVVYGMERKKGGEGFKDLLQQADGVKNAIREAVNQCRHTKKEAFRDWIGSRRHLIARNTRKLMLRTKAVIDTVLLSRSGMPAATKDPGTTEGSKAGKPGGREDLCLFNEATSCQVLLRTEKLKTDELSQELVETFHQDWSKFCRENDVSLAGYLPGVKLVEMLVEFRDKWQSKFIEEMTVRKIDEACRSENIDRKLNDDILPAISAMFPGDVFFSANVQDVNSNNRTAKKSFYGNSIRINAETWRHNDISILCRSVEIRELKRLALIGFYLEVEHWARKSQATGRAE